MMTQMLVDIAYLYTKVVGQWVSRGAPYVGRAWCV